MRRILTLAVLLLVTACGTPQENCIRAATRDLRAVTALIAEIEGNLARGYAWETYEIERTHWVICGYYPPATEGGTPRPRYCLEDDTDIIRRRVAIDPEAEQRKLAALKKKLTELNRKAAADIAACKAEFPE